MRIKIILISGLMLLLLFCNIVGGEGQAQELTLQPVFKDIPDFARLTTNENGLKYELKMIKIDNNAKILKPPVTEAKILYFGVVKLGNPGMEYGVLLDFEGTKKLIWIDSDADMDYAEETPVEIFKSDRYPGINVYYAPEPFTFQVTYHFSDHDYQTKLLFELPYLLIDRIGNSDLFYLKNRTWFTGILLDNGAENRVALVDANDNSLYNDPEDLIYIDKDYDLNFIAKESTPIKKMKEFKFKSKARFVVDYQYSPEKLVLQ